jgi:hypothetical protein
MIINSHKYCIENDKIKGTATNKRLLFMLFAANAPIANAKKARQQPSRSLQPKKKPFIDKRKY